MLRSAIFLVSTLVPLACLRLHGRINTRQIRQRDRGGASARRSNHEQPAANDPETISAIKGDRKARRDDGVSFRPRYGVETSILYLRIFSHRRFVPRGAHLAPPAAAPDEPSFNVVYRSIGTEDHSSVRPPGQTTRTRGASVDVPRPTSTRGSLADA